MAGGGCGPRRGQGDRWAKIKKYPAVMPCTNSSFEHNVNKVEPNLTLLTSSQGLSAASEVKAP